MKKSLLMAVTVLGLVGLTSCGLKEGEEKRVGYDSAACRSKCERLGQNILITASREQGQCICTTETLREDHTR
jgi:hypothetical protein